LYNGFWVHKATELDALSSWGIVRGFLGVAYVTGVSGSLRDGSFVDEGTRERAEKLGREVVRFSGVGVCECFESGGRGC